MNGPARRHHMDMKYQLARMALQDPGRFFTTLGPGGDADFLSDLWTAMGARLPAADRVPSDGVETWHRPVGRGPELLVLTLPAALHRNEAHFLGVARLRDGGCRVFCLERSVSPAGAETTVLVELAADGRSLWDAGSSAVRDDFVASIDRLVASRAATPIAFVPLDLA